MTFTITTLAGGQALVEGTDSRGTTNSIVVCTDQYDYIVNHDAVHKAQEEFDRAAEEFYAPLAAAADALQAAHTPEEDPLTYMVLHEGVSAVEGVKEDRMILDHDSQILRLIHNGLDHRLLWVKDELVITAYTGEDETPAEAEAGTQNAPF